MFDEIRGGNLQDRRIQFRHAHDDKHQKRGNQHPGHYLLSLCHDVHAAQVNHIKQGQEYDSHNTRIQLGPQGIGIHAQGNPEQGNAHGLPQEGHCVHPCRLLIGKTRQHGVIPSSQPQCGRHPHHRHNHQEPPYDGCPICKPGRVSCQRHGRTHKGDDSCPDYLSDGQGVQLRLLKDTWRGRWNVCNFAAFLLHNESSFYEFPIYLFTCSLG